MDLKERDLLGSSQADHWYHVGKLGALTRCLDRPPTRILDVGAGSGFFARGLLERTNAASAVCVDTGYDGDRIESLDNGKTIEFRRGGSSRDADLVLLMDVIEHVDDDAALIAEYAADARPGTRFVVSVPAFQWLWSPHDEFLEHRRRYTLGGLLKTVSDGGLVPVDGFYFFAAIFPAAAAARVCRRRAAAGTPPASDLRRHHPLTNWLLARACLAECAIARHNRAFGLTAFAVATKA